MKYKLTDEDYLRLWAVAFPSQIEHEFGKERSRCARQIYRFYRKYGLSEIKKSRQEIEAKALSESPMNAGVKWINQEMGRLFAEAQEVEFRRTWEKITRYEDQWNACS